jgi:hypothetical protein
LDAVKQLHAYRRRKRIQDLDWFEAAYRVYLTGILGIVITLFAASFIGDKELDASGIAKLRDHGPAALGLVVAVAIFLGLRSGSRGGPLAVEPAEVRYVLLAPVERRHALWPAAFKSARFATFAGAVVGAIGGYLAHRRIPDGATAAWVASGLVTGALIALALVGSALIASGVRLRRWIATILGFAVIGWAVADLVAGVPAPTTTIGSIALWPLRVRPLDVLGAIAVVASVAIGTALLNGLSLEAAERRTALVGQLRFAVTVQDLRTVMVLRRQLAQDRSRQRPWLRLHSGHRRRTTVWHRDWQGVLRFPAPRLLRMVVLTIGSAFVLLAVYHGTTPLVIVSALAMYLVGLDAVEPLSQEIDQSDRADALPVERGVLLAQHAAVPAVVMLLVGALGYLAVLAVERTATAAAVGAISLVAVAWSGAAGAAVTVGLGTPEPMKDGQLLPPEVAGLKIAVRTAWPLIVGVIGTLPVLAARRFADRGQSPVGGAAQAAFLPLLVVLMTVAWLRFREPAKAWWHQLLNEGQQAAKTRDQQRRRTA